MNDNKLRQLKEMVASSYEVAAKHFAATRVKAPGLDFFWAMGHIQIDDLVLDAGCGNGRLLDWLSIDPKNYHGIDQSRALIEIARQDHPAFQFEAADLTNINSLPANKYSAVFCSAVLGHIPGKNDRIKALKNIYNATTPGGKLIISYWKFRGKYRRQLYQTWLKKIRGGHPYGWFDFVFPWKGDDGKEMATRYYHLFTRSGFRREIESAGWKVIKDNNSGYNYWIIAEKA